MDVKKVKRTMKVGPKKDKTLYGLQWVNYGNVSSEALLQEVEAATTLSDSDAELLVKEFANVVIGYVANGHSVDLGVLGTLSPKITAKAVDSEKDCTAQTIGSIGVLYRSRKELTDDAKAMSITMLSSSVARQRPQRTMATRATTVAMAALHPVVVVPAMTAVL